jgi:Fe-S oxidoreductase
LAGVVANARNERRLSEFGRGENRGQMFKEPEKGDKDVNLERTEQAMETQPQIIAAGCPFCNTMMTDGIKAKDKEASVKVLDIAELIAMAQDL